MAQGANILSSGASSIGNQYSMEQALAKIGVNQPIDKQATTGQATTGQAIPGQSTPVQNLPSSNPNPYNISDPVAIIAQPNNPYGNQEIDPNLMYGSGSGVEPTMTTQIPMEMANMY
jgi:K+-transporting ATPase c subunit